MGLTGASWTNPMEQPLTGFSNSSVFNTDSGSDIETAPSCSISDWRNRLPTPRKSDPTADGGHARR